MFSLKLADLHTFRDGLNQIGPVRPRTVQSENRITKGLNSIMNSLPNFSQLPVVANRTLAATIQEYQRLQILMQDRATKDVALVQKMIQNFSNEASAIASNSNTFSLTNYKAYMDLWINYRTELVRIVYQVVNDVYTLFTTELPKSLNRILLAARKQGLVLI